MANENFGLSFTVEQLAAWNEQTEGKLSEASTVFSDLVALEKVSEASTVFADLVALEKVSEASTVSADGICAPPSRMSAPGYSSLGPGGPQSTASCP